jgi:trimethylamine:corrinoid methyltransferase-like protein
MYRNIVASPYWSMLSHEQCKVIHRASLEILWHTGVRVYQDGALALLRQTDAVLTDGLQQLYALFRKSSTF